MNLLCIIFKKVLNSLILPYQLDENPTFQVRFGQSETMKFITITRLNGPIQKVTFVLNVNEISFYGNDL